MEYKNIYDVTLRIINDEWHSALKLHLEKVKSNAPYVSKTNAS